MKKEPRIIAKAALDDIIKKSRVHLYKPIQIAESLYRHRTIGDINLSKLEEYRTKSKRWRDAISLPLLGRICTSSAKYQDNLFEENAIPPRILVILGSENVKTKGAVEAYIYSRFANKHTQLAAALEYCQNANPQNFDVKTFIDSFWNEPGLRRSIDKVYEIIVYSLFTTLVEAMHLQVKISITDDALPLLKEFEDFSKKVMCLDATNVIFAQNANVYRVGVTNAADRGLDMYSNWGPAIQIKHLTLDEELAKSIAEGVTSDKIIIVCKDADKRVIESILLQIGWGYKIQSVVTESDLVVWYDKALRGEYASQLSESLLKTLVEEISNEFPSVNEVPQVLAERHYETISDEFWKIEA